MNKNQAINEAAQVLRDKIIEIEKALQKYPLEEVRVTIAVAGTTTVASYTSVEQLVWGSLQGNTHRIFHQAMRGAVTPLATAPQEVLLKVVTTNHGKAHLARLVKKVQEQSEENRRLEAIMTAVTECNRLLQDL